MVSEKNKTASTDSEPSVLRDSHHHLPLKGKPKRTWHHLLYGTLFGAGFPIVGSMVQAYLDYGDIGVQSLLRAQAESPLLWIVDSAPLVLGTLGAVIGWQRDRIVAVLKGLDDLVEQRTGELERMCTRSQLESVRAKRAERGLRSIFSATPLGMVVVGPEGRIKHWNEAVCQIWDCVDIDLLDRPVAEVAPKEVVGELVRMNSSLSDSSDRICLEVFCERAEGDNAYIRMTAGQFRPDADKDPGLLVVLEDVTTRRQAEHEMQAMEIQLQERQKLEAIGQLAAGIAHEINTPTQYVSDNTAFLQRGFGGMVEALQACQGVVDAVEAGTAEPDQAKSARKALGKAKVDFLLKQVPRAIEQSLDGLNRISNIVAALKEFSHPSQGQKQPVELGHVVETTVTVASNEWKYVAEVDLQLDPSLPAVPALQDELSQVLLNLIVNAAHAIVDARVDVDGGEQEKGTITIQTARDGEHAVIRVRDTGNGVPPEIRDKIFNPFFTTKDVGRGTGQGLAIARSVVVDKHDGDLSLEGAPGEGACFVIRLPLVDAGNLPGEEAA